MNFENLDTYLLAKPGTTPEYPFDETTRVYKVMGKMFGLIGEDWEQLAVNLKCDPDRAQTLRHTFEAIKPGYHMNKEHWNTVYVDGSLPDDLLTELIDHSYDLVVAKLKKADREKLKSLSK